MNSCPLSYKMLKQWSLTFPYRRKGRYLSVGVQSSRTYCTGTLADHAGDETADSLSDSSCLCHYSRTHPTTQVSVTQTNGEAMELVALRTQDALSSGLPFPLSKPKYVNTQHGSIYGVRKRICHRKLNHSCMCKWKQSGSGDKHSFICK
jgi:hypothetical protein